MLERLGIDRSVAERTLLAVLILLLALEPRLTAGGVEEVHADRYPKQLLILLKFFHANNAFY